MRTTTPFIAALIVLTALLLLAERVPAYQEFGNNVNALCAPETPFTGDCSLCHISPYSASTPAKQAYLAGGNTLLAYFCPSVLQVCTDNDNDTYAVQGGDCGPVDCNDADASIHPGALEICGDGIDQDCNGSDLKCPSVLPPMLYLLKEKKM